MTRPAPRTIDVLANPYSGVNHEGLPQGVVQMPNTRGNFIGAHFDQIASEQTGKNRFYYAQPNAAKDEKGACGLRKVTVPFTAEIARAVLEGGLIVATKEDARMCGLAEKDFVEPEKQLAAELARATAERDAEGRDHGPLAAIPLEPTKSDEELAVDAKAAAAAKPATKARVAAEPPREGIIIRKPEES